MSAATPSTYFSSSHARRLFPIPAIPTTEARRARPSRVVAWSRSLRSCSSSSRPTKGGSTRLLRPAPRRPATTRTARHAGTGAVLPRRSCSPAASKTIASPAARSVASPTSTVPGGRGRLEPRGGVHEIAGHHPLALRPDDRRSLAGQHRGPCLRAILAGRREARHRGHEVQRGAHGPLGVVLADGRRAPDGHDRVADELLDRAAVPLHDLAGDVEVAAEELADGLRVAVVGQGREADEIGEEDADEPALGRSRRAAGRRAGAGRDGARAWPLAAGAPRPPAAPDPPMSAPQSPQKRSSGSLAAPQAGQVVAMAAPHDRQNFRPGRFSLPHAPQFTAGVWRARRPASRGEVAGQGGRGGFRARWLPGQVRAER